MEITLKDFKKKKLSFFSGQRCICCGCELHETNRHPYDYLLEDLDYWLSLVDVEDGGVFHYKEKDKDDFNEEEITIGICHDCDLLNTETFSQKVAERLIEEGELVRED